MGRPLLLLLLLSGRSLALLPLNLSSPLSLLLLLLPSSLFFGHSGGNIHALRWGLLLLLLLQRLAPRVERYSPDIRRGWLWCGILLRRRLLLSISSSTTTDANHIHETGAGRLLSTRLDTSRRLRRRRGRGGGVRVRIPKVLKDIDIIPRARSDLGTIANLPGVLILSILTAAFEVAGRADPAGILVAAVKLFLELLGSLGHGRQVESGGPPEAGGRSSSAPRAGDVVEGAAEGTEIAGGGGRRGGVVPKVVGVVDIVVVPAAAAAPLGRGEGLAALPAVSASSAPALEAAGRAGRRSGAAADASDVGGSAALLEGLGPDLVRVEGVEAYCEESIPTPHRMGWVCVSIKRHTQT